MNHAWFVGVVDMGLYRFARVECFDCGVDINPVYFSGQRERAWATEVAYSLGLAAHGRPARFL